MCLVVYVASSVRPGLIPWNESVRSFHVSEIDDAPRVMRESAGCAHVVYAGSNQGCGCGFGFGEPRFDEDGWEDEECRACREQIAAYIGELLQRGAEVLLYTCIDGDQDEPAVGRRTTTPSCVVDDPLVIEERVLLRVVASHTTTVRGRFT